MVEKLRICSELSQNNMPGGPMPHFCTHCGGLLTTHHPLPTYEVPGSLREFSLSLHNPSPFKQGTGKFCGQSPTSGGWRPRCQPGHPTPEPTSLTMLPAALGGLMTVVFSGLAAPQQSVTC